MELYIKNAGKYECAECVKDFDLTMLKEAR